MASVASVLVQKLNRFFPLNQDELASLAGLEARRRTITAHTEVVHERQEGHHAFILQEGWACAYKLLPDGGRQVIDFSVPGDFMGLRSVLLRTSDHAFAAVSDIVVAEVSAQQMIDTFHRLPRWGRRSCGRPRATRRWWSPGQRRAAQRPGAHRPSPARARATSAARRARLGQRLRLPAQPVSPGRCAGAHRDPREPRPATAARAEAGDLPGRRVEFHDLKSLRDLADYHSGYLDQSNGLGL
jgi:CRP-like cAMP-binding protein